MGKLQAGIRLTDGRRMGYNGGNGSTRLEIMKTLFAAVVLIAFSGNAWMDAWAPSFKFEPIKMLKLSKENVRDYVQKNGEDYGDLSLEYSEGGALDLNGDGVCDFVYVLPWMGCGLNASGYDVHFVVSNGAGGMRKSVLSGYGVELSDLVKVAGKVYFRHSDFFGPFQKSNHNHWVYQLFSFDAKGVMRSANSAVGKPFPAVTIFYEKPKFKQIELTIADLRKIEKETQAKTVKKTAK